MYTNNIFVDLSDIQKFMDFFMGQAYAWASLSKDPSTRVGAVAIQGDQMVCQGWNGFPRGVADDPLLLNDRAQKYPRVVHAERNVINNAARKGIRLEGSVFVVTHHPCPRCAGDIIQVGARAVVFDGKTLTDDFRKRMEIDIAEDLLFKAKIPVVGVHYDVVHI